MNDPYLAKDIAHANAEDREWLRSLAVEQRAAEILSDARLLDDAVGDQAYSNVKFDLDSFIIARQRLAVATTYSAIMSAAKAFKLELDRIATAQAEQEIPE